MDKKNRVIYLKYRPEKFDELIGQDHVVIPLKNALDTDKVAHAYLFSGPRGCGKTTSARILAKCLNCEKGVSSKPCGVCQSCKDLGNNGSGSLDVIEMDAASHGHVDDARDLEQKLSFSTVRDRYRIIILDEAHMITKEGFNALLKSVEEPPPHVKFIFATTEPEKVIATIRSRTYHYPFKLVSPELLKKYINEICKKENIEISESILDIVIKAGGGSVRDTESVLDQLISGAVIKGKKIDEKIAVALLGFTPNEILENLIDACFSNEPKVVFSLIKKSVELGQDERRFLEDILFALQKHISKTVEHSDTKQSKFSFNKLAIFSSIVNSGLYESVQNLAPELHLNVIFSKILLKLNPPIKVFDASNNDNNEITNKKVDNQNNRNKSEESNEISENSTKNNASNISNKQNSTLTHSTETLENTKNPKTSVINGEPNSDEPNSGIKPNIPEVTGDWKKIIDEIKNIRTLTSAFLSNNAKFNKIDGDTIYISFFNKVDLDGFNFGKHDLTLIEAVSKVFPKKAKKVKADIVNLKHKKTVNKVDNKKVDTEKNIDIEKSANFITREIGGEIIK